MNAIQELFTALSEERLWYLFSIADVLYLNEMLRISGIFEKVSIRACIDHEKDQTHALLGHLVIVSEVFFNTVLSFKLNHICCRFMRHTHLQMLTSEGVRVVRKTSLQVFRQGSH
jgi:hypothetical protein